MQVLIRDNERALVLRDGRANRWLGAGKHTLWTWTAKLEVVRFNLDEAWATATPELERLVPTDDGTLFVVPAGHVGLVRRNGEPDSVLRPGRFILWQARAEVTSELVDAREIALDLPRRFGVLAPADFIRTIVVGANFRGVLEVDGVIQRVLTPGRYSFGVVDRDVDVMQLDMREQELQVTGQEVMTNDKVTLRVNVVVRFQIVDAVEALTAVTALHDAVYTAAQMAVRRFIGRNTLDNLLERRSDVADELGQAMKITAAWGIRVVEIGIKDVVLPGDMKMLLNRVVEAEKQATANLIMRREETAATRSMANTAKMFEANPTLLRLKELEMLKDVVAQVDNITVVADHEMLSGLLKR